MLRSILCLTGILVAWTVGHPDAAWATEPEVSIQTHEDWFETTYTINMNREAAERLNDVLDRVDLKLIGAVL